MQNVLRNERHAEGSKNPSMGRHFHADNRARNHQKGRRQDPKATWWFSGQIDMPALHSTRHVSH